MCNFNLNTEAGTETLLLFAVCVTQHRFYASPSCEVYIESPASNHSNQSQMPTTPPPPGHAVPSRHTQPLLVPGENCSDMFTQEGNSCAAGIKYFIWGRKKKKMLASFSECLCWSPLSPAAGREACSLLLPTLGIILLSKASQKKNKCHFDVRFSGDLRLSHLPW